MKQKTSLIENNGTFYLRIPPALKDYLGIEVGQEIIIEDKEKSKGKYAAFWKGDSDGKKQ